MNLELIAWAVVIRPSTSAPAKVIERVTTQPDAIDFLEAMVIYAETDSAAAERGFLREVELGGVSVSDGKTEVRTVYTISLSGEGLPTIEDITWRRLRGVTGLIVEKV